MNTLYRRLPLDGMVNCRELGGYPAADGKTTSYHRFIRHEIPRGLSQRDLDFLKEYGVTASLDLRGGHELARLPSELGSVAWIKYINLPLANKQAAAGAGMKIGEFVRWGELYISMIERGGDWVCSVLSAMAHQDGAVMFNCTTGKDRTGLISALLLGLAGVSNEDIIADYCISQVYMRPKFAELNSMLPPLIDADGNESPTDIDGPFFKTSPDNMQVLLEHFDANYGGVEGFVRKCGVEENVISSLRRKLLD